MRRLAPSFLLQAIFTALLGSGCGGDPGPTDAPIEDSGTPVNDAPPLDAPGLDAPSLDAPAADAPPDAPITGATRTTLGAAGGTALSADGLFEIVVLPGALTADVEIVITPVAAADLPADVAATEPLTTVYSVEPDGLVFGGDGAIVHYHLDETPAALIDDAGATRAYGAAFALARPAAGGAIEAQPDPDTLHGVDGAFDVVAGLPHLSLHWAVRRWFAADFWLGTDFGASNHEVGQSWPQTLFARASTPFSAVDVAVASEGARVGTAAHIEPSGAGYMTAVRTARDALLADLGRLPARRLSRAYTDEGPYFPAGVDHQLLPYPRWTCRSVGGDYLTVSAEFAIAGTRPRVIVGEPSACVEPFPVEVSILDSVPGFREDVAILTDTAPFPEVRVETRGEGTRTVTLSGTPYSVILEPAAAPPVAGPDTLTATNNGATMTATRDDVTGEYDAIIDDPSLWEPEQPTEVSDGTSSPRTASPVPPFGVTFGPVAGLDTGLGLAAGTELAVRFPGVLRCGPEDVEDVVLFRSIVDELPVGGVLREALALLASYCERSVSELSARAFTVEVSRQERVYFEMPGVGASFRVGRAVTLNGPDLLAMCGFTRPTFCRDRCVNLAEDPMNCGGCGVVGVEVCDGIDNDCDFYEDDGCPTQIAWPASVAETSVMFGDTTSASTGTGGMLGAYFNPYIGFCGTTNTDGTIRAISPVIASVALRRTGTETFVLDVTEAHPGGIRCEDGTFTPSGGDSFGIRCPDGMLADGVSGMAPATGHIGQVLLSCARWGVVRDVSRRWVIRRTETGMSMSAGTGPGMPFSFMARDDATTDNPSALRYLQSRYRSLAPGGMPGGVLWLRVGASSPTLVQ